MLEPELIENKAMRAITCAVIRQARVDIVRGSEVELVQLLCWLREKNNYWFNCLEIFCDLDSEHIKKHLIKLAQERLNAKQHVDPRQLRMFNKNVE